MATLFPKFNFKEWIDENRHLLKPPVGNKVVWPEGDFIVMVVGGPNSRKDYHINHTPEFFYQLEGDITLKVMDNGEPKDIHIKEGEIYLHPPSVPHGPMRGESTIGLVIEQKRPEDMMDACVWFCENCNNELYREEFKLDNIETDMPIIFDKYYGNKDLRTCNECGTVMEPPKAVAEVE